MYRHREMGGGGEGESLGQPNYFDTRHNVHHGLRV